MKCLRCLCYLLLALSACVASRPLAPLPPVSVAAVPDSIPGQRITARVVPLLRQGRWGLAVPGGQVVVPPTYENSFTQVVDGYKQPGLFWQVAGNETEGGIWLFSPQGARLGHFQAIRKFVKGGWVAAAGHDSVSVFAANGQRRCRVPYPGIRPELSAEGLLEVGTRGDMATAQTTDYASQVGLLDTLGRVVVPVRYRSVGSSFDHGLLAVENRAGVPGVVDRQGHAYWRPNAFPDDWAEFYYPYWLLRSSSRKSMAVLSLTGQVLLPYGRYSRIGQWPGSRALLVTQPVRMPGPPGWQLELVGLYDSLLRPVLPARFIDLVQSGPWVIAYAPGLPQSAAKANGGSYHSLKGAYYGGRLVVPLRYEAVGATHVGDYRVLTARLLDKGALNIVAHASPDSISYSVHFYGPGGQLRLRPARHQPAYYLGFGLFALRQNHRWSLLDSTGRPVLAQTFDEIEAPALPSNNSHYTPQYQPLLLVQAAGRWGILDTLGHYRLPLTAAYTKLLPLPSLFVVPRASADTLLAAQCDSLEGVISHTGRVLVPPLFKAADRYRAMSQPPSYRLEKTEEFTGQTIGGALLYGRAGRVLTDFRPLLPAGATEGYMFYEAPNRLRLSWSNPDHKRHTALYDGSGRQLSPEDVHHLESFANGVAWASQDGLSWAVMDLNGKLLTPFRYTQHEPFYDGIAQTATAEQPVVWVDCFGHEYRE